MVHSLVFDQDEAAWNVTVEYLKTGKHEPIKANAVFNAFGTTDRWKLPDIPGIKSFKGVASRQNAASILSPLRPI